MTYVTFFSNSILAFIIFIWRRIFDVATGIAMFIISGSFHDIYYQVQINIFRQIHSSKTVEGYYVFNPLSAL
jgi:hypothetical protein